MRPSALAKLASTLAAAWLLALAACSHSPSTPVGQLQVHVTENFDGPSPGKRVELVGTGLAQVTDPQGLATFTVRAGPYVVRAYDLGTPGPGRAFVERDVTVENGRTTQAEFVDCTMCR
jgi:hypothetical protein